MSEISLLSLARADLKRVGTDVSNRLLFYKMQSCHFCCPLSELLSLSSWREITTNATRAAWEKKRTENTLGLLLMSIDDLTSYDAISSVWCYHLLQITTVINCNLKKLWSDYYNIDSCFHGLFFKRENSKGFAWRTASCLTARICLRCTWPREQQTQKAGWIFPAYRERVQDLLYLSFKYGYLDRQSKSPNLWIKVYKVCFHQNVFLLFSCRIYAGLIITNFWKEF